MPLEEVGICDDLVWKMPRDIQDMYYPFMDNLHSMLDMSRLPYEAGNNLKEEFAKRHGGEWAQVSESTQELCFPDEIEQLYQTSLVLRVE